MSEAIYKSTNRIAEVELVYHNKTKVSERPRVSSSKEAYKMFLDTWDMGKIELQEQFKILLLDRKSSCIGITTLASGGTASCIVDFKLAFAAAIKACASALVIAHNHPSGNTSPSDEDKSLTARFAIAARLLDFQLLDHVIVTKESYLSFADEGLLTGGFRSEMTLPF